MGNYTATATYPITGVASDSQVYLGPCEVTLVLQTFGTSTSTIALHDSTAADNEVFRWIGPTAGTDSLTGFSIYFHTGVFIEFVAGGGAATATTIGIR